MRFFPVIALGAVLALASCKDNGMGPSPVVDGVFIHSSLGNATVNVFADDPQFVVPIMRTNKSGAVTANLVWTSENTAIFSDLPASVSFSDGQDRVDLTIPVNTDLLEFGKPVKTNLSLEDCPTTPYGLSAATMNIVKPLIWEAWATGLYTSGFIGFVDPETEDDTYELEFTLERAKGLNMFRFPDLYAKGYDYVFEWDVDNQDTSIMPIGESATLGGTPVIYQNTGIRYTQVTGAYIYLFTDYDEDYTGYDPDTQTLWINSYNGVLDAGGVLLGGYGWFDDTFEIETFIQDNPWE